MKKIILSSLLVFAVVALTFSYVYAKKDYATQFNNFYETFGTEGGTDLGSCITCHKQLDGHGGLNPYGQDWKDASRNFKAIEPYDSDDDGVDNLTEIIEDSLPGDPTSIPAEPTNHPPIANAGADQTVTLGDTVTLDGSGSGDADSDQLSFSWAFVSRPQESTAVLSDPGAVNPVFDVDLPGTYVVQLIVNDGMVDSAPDEVTISTRNSAPIADAGGDQTVSVGDTVTLDASNSSDVDGDSLSFIWSFVSVPAGSDAVISDPTAIMPAFYVDVFGSYVVQLIVTDGSLSSAPDTVTISTRNSAPVADAGSDQAVSVGDTVILDSSGSGDKDGDMLTFIWSLSSVPANSSAVLSDPTAVKPSFVVDVPGTYIVQLIVHDGKVDSDPDTVTISTENSTPVAEAGKRQRARVGDTVTLDGSQSTDADGDPLTFSWSLTSRPEASIAKLPDPASTAATFAFVPDFPGTYVVQLIVNDGTQNSDPDTCIVRVRKQNQNGGKGGGKGNGNGKGPASGN